MSAMVVWFGKAADDVIVIGQVVAAKLRLCWPSCSVSTEYVTRMIQTASAI